MRKQQHSKSGLFLIELMITILFFSITAAVCVQAFVKSHTISQDAKALSKAQILASSVAEVLEESTDFDKSLQEYLPELTEGNKNNYLTYYDKKWNITKENDKGNAPDTSATKDWYYKLSVSWEDIHPLCPVRILISDRKGNTVYQLDVSVCVPEKGGDPL